MKHFDGTIAAIATPTGTGGVGVVRLSGPEALPILRQIFLTKADPPVFDSHRAYHGWIWDQEKGIRVDQVMVVYMMGPRSYTGEDVVEISGHGSGLVLRRILELTVQAGARLAGRGEFTKRAFLGGKIDLAQAEAVLDLVSARTSLGHEAAVCQLEGRLSAEIRDMRAELLDVLAGIEAGIDFPEDVETLGLKDLGSRIGAWLARTDRLLQTADGGKIVREGVRTAIVGKPNVGKSSLLNALLGEPRAIVTDEPGTTRDTIEEVVDIGGLPLVVVDTAGIRHPRDKAEEFGVERARREIGESDLSLVVIDASAELTAEDQVVLDETGGRDALIVLNKIDLGCRVSLNGSAEQGGCFKVSALSGEGVERLKQGVLDFLGGRRLFESGGKALVNLRQKECLVRAREALCRAQDSVRAGMPVDFLSIDLKGAAVALGEISGEAVSEEIINTIFERFCVGK